MYASRTFPVHRRPLPTPPPAAPPPSPLLKMLTQPVSITRLTFPAPIVSFPLPCRPQMRAVILALAFGAASAFMGAPVAPSARSTSAIKMTTQDELAALAESNRDSLGAGIGFWDPLGCSKMSFWTLSNEETIGYLRHAEIKHGRVAMAAFLGFCVQSLDAVKGEHSTVPYRGFVADVTPQEQWDNIPVIGKLQILTFVGMLESYGEIPGEVPHYTQPGGIPGYYPPLIGKRPEFLFNLYDPFNFFEDDTAEDKERGLNVEVNNGRAAMLAIIAMLSASKGLVVPPLDAIEGFPKYTGDVMVPFEGQLHVAMPELAAWTEQTLAR